MGQPSRPAKAGLLLGAFLLIATTVSANKCTVGCHGHQPGQSYQEGHTYVYDLEGWSESAMHEDQNKAKLELKATVELTAKPNCVRQLRLKNVQLNKAPVASADVEKYAVQFNYHDGHIDTEICTEPGDSQTSLNIKRAVISLFQSAVLRDRKSSYYNEVDVFGGCPTHFNVNEEGDTVHVNKERDIELCSHRENLQQGLVSSIFNPEAGVKSTSVLRSSHSVRQTFKNGILNSVKSSEVYKFQPFRNGDAGAQTTVKINLSLKSEKDDSPAAPVAEPKSIIFDVPHPVLNSSPEAISNALKAAKNEETDGAKAKAAEKFADLVKVLRVSSKNDILSVYHKVQAGAGFDKVNDKKILLEALFRAGTGESAEVAVELVKHNDISGTQALIFYASLALVNHVHLPSVSTIVTLLDQRDLPRIGYLGVGQVIGKYCQQHNCDNVPEIKNAIGKLRQKVGNGKAKNREQENQMITALKALGNTRYLDDATLQKLANIASDKNVRNRVRVAAIESLPTRCSMKWKTMMMKTLEDLDEDSEIRIKTYLALVECPCPHVANHLKETLDKETINQVGSFITTHLRNLRASTDPNKQEAKRQLGLIKPRTKFPEDFRKFSFNDEFSYNIDALGIGSTVESNVIYSQNSFVPRSASLNLTTEIFGHTFNLLELNSRAENLDRLIEHYFGPKGEVTNIDLEEFAEESIPHAKDVAEYIKEKLQKLSRRRREVKQAELDKFAKNVHLKGTEIDQNLDLDLSVKLFGVELAYLSYQGDTSKLSLKNVIDKVFENLDKGLGKFKNFDYDLQNHMQFLDADLVYPTNMGIPLSIGVTGTSVVHLKTKGKLDIPAMIKDPQNAALRLAIEPSASLRISGNIVMSGFGVESGLKIATTLHTSTGTDVSVKMLEGNGIDVNIGIPKKKQEIVNFESQVLISSGPNGGEYVPLEYPKGRESSDCFDQLSSLLGLTVCGSIVYPYDGIESIKQKPFPPLNGPVKFSLTLENNDVNSYHFKAYYDTKTPKVRSLEILLETPQSRTNRHISLVLKGGLEPDKFIKASFDSPIRKLSGEVILKNNPKEHTLTVTFHNDQIVYHARAGIVQDGSKYKPVLEYKVPEHIEQLAGSKTGINIKSNGGQNYNVEGTVDVSDADGGKKYVFNKVYLVAGNRKLFGLDGWALSTPNTVQMDMNVGYGDETLALKLNGNRLAERKYDVSLSAVPSKDPNVGFNVKWEYQRESTELDHKLTFIHGADPNSETNRLSLKQHAVYDVNPKNWNVAASNKLTYPAVGLVFELDGGVTQKSIAGEIKFKYDNFKFGTELSARTGLKQPGDYEVEFEAELLNNAIEIKSKRMILDSHKNRFQNSLKLTPGGKYEADVTVVHDIKGQNVKLQMEGDINLNEKKVNVETALETNPQKVNSRAVVTFDGTKYVDFLLAIQRGPRPNGKLNLNLKNYLTAIGAYDYQNGKGNGHIDIDIPKINRKIKGTGNVAVSGSQYTADAQLLYDADKDPSKKIKFTTSSNIKQNAFDTKNVLEIMTYKLEVNAKCTHEGEFNNGKQNGEVEITLPNGRYIVYKLDRAIAKQDTVYTGHIDTELTDHVNKGGKSRKFIYKGQAHNVDFMTNNFDLNYDIQYVNFEGKDAKLIAGVKHLNKNDEKKTCMVAADLSGSLMPKPVNLAVSTDYSKKDATWKGKSTVGENFAVEGSGSVFCEKGKPHKFDANVKAKLPSEKLRNIKWEVSHSMLVPTEEGGAFEQSSTHKITYNDDKVIKVACNHEHKGIFDEEHPSEGSGQMTVEVHDNPPMTIGGSYKHDPKGELHKFSGSLNSKYGEKDMNVAAETSYKPDLSEVGLDLKATTSVEKLRNVHLQLQHKREKDGTVRKTDVTLTTDDAKYTLFGEIHADKISPMINVVFTCPSGKTELLAKFNKLDESDYTGEWKLETPKGFVATDARINLKSIDDFIITINFDSDKIKQRKIHAEIANNPTLKTGRKITVVVTSDGKNIVTGSTNYKKRDEDGKIVVEGNGNLKIGENTRSSSFKYTRQQLTREVDGEVGVAMVLNANFGPSAIVGELKISNKEILVFNSYCEQNKDCAHFKLQAAYDTDQKSYMKHQITVEVDLKKFNVPVEYGLKTSTEYKNFQFDHMASLYLHSSKDKSEYSHQLYVHPKEAASILTLPSREIALIATYDMPKTKQTGAYKFDLSHYVDRKNRPTEKACLTLTGDINVENNSGSMNGEARFTYPSQPKDMTVKGKLHYGGANLLDANLDLDVFAKKAQKITIAAKMVRGEIEKGYNVTGSAEILSRGQQLKIELQNHLAVSSNQLGFGSFLSYNDIHQKPRNLGVLFSANPEAVDLLVALPNRDLVKSNTKLNFDKKLLKIESELSLMGDKPIVFYFEAEELNSFKYLEYSKSNPNTKLTVNGRLVLGQLVEAHADAYKDGAKKNLFNILIHLDEDKFLKPDFGYNKDNLVAVIEHYKNKVTEAVKRMREMTQEVAKEAVTELKDLVDHLKKAQPNMKPLLDYYEAERNKIRNELHTDETVKEIQAALNKLFGGISDIIMKTIQQVSERVNDIYRQCVEIASKLMDAIKATYPQLLESYNKVFNIFVEVMDAAVNLGMTYLKALLNIINEHQKEIKEMAIVLSELVQDIAKIFVKSASQIRKDAEEFIVLLSQQIKALPIYEIIKEKYEEILRFEVPEAIISPIEEICNSIKAVLPTPELKEFFSVTCDAFMKFLKREKVDGVNELKQISAHAVTALQSIISLLQSHISSDNLIGFLEARIPFDLSFLSKLPGIATLKVSLVNLLRNRELPTHMDLYYAYRPTMRVTDIIPPFSKTGIIADGGHFFTFDGRHFTLPGSCQYILAQDFQDGNFSVVANLNNGNLVSITLTEPKESVTIQSDGHILVNGKPSEYPANTKNIDAFLISPFANMKSKYGVHVVCPDHAPLVCSVHISGFYLGKIRGLLGDGNNEPYDDYTLPSGKTADNAGDFGNAYKLKPDCPAATAVSHEMKRAPVCTEYFSGNSPLSPCFNYVNPTNYREACDHAVSANTPEGPCLIAVAYYASCREARVRVNLPPACGKCKVGGKDISVDDSFSVKIPQKEADIVFVVEQDVQNEKIFKELVKPLMNDVRDELKQHGITDVHIGLIGFGEKMKYPQHYTVNGDRNIKGDVKNMKFEAKDPIISLEEAKEGDYEKKMGYIGQRMDVELGTFKLTDAYEEAIRYPFRAGAAKAVVGILANPCEKSPLPISFQHLRLLLGQLIYRERGLTYYHVSFPGEMQLSGKPAKNVVGYDKHSAYTFADGKKKPMEGNADLRNNLEIPVKDVCADFAINSGGTAFSANNFLDAKPNQKKQYAQVFVKRIAEDLANIELEEDCVCAQEHGLIARPQCSIVGRKDKVHATKGGVKA